VGPKDTFFNFLSITDFTGHLLHSPSFFTGIFHFNFRGETNSVRPRRTAIQHNISWEHTPFRTGGIYGGTPWGGAPNYRGKHRLRGFTTTRESVETVIEPHSERASGATACQQNPSADRVITSPRRLKGRGRQTGRSCARDKPGG